MAVLRGHVGVFLRVGEVARAGSAAAAAGSGWLAANASIAAVDADFRRARRRGSPCRGRR